MLASPLAMSLSSKVLPGPVARDQADEARLDPVAAHPWVSAVDRDRRPVRRDVTAVQLEPTAHDEHGDSTVVRVPEGHVRDPAGLRAELNEEASLPWTTISRGFSITRCSS